MIAVVVDGVVVDGVVFVGGDVGDVVVTEETRAGVWIPQTCDVLDGPFRVSVKGGQIRRY